MKTLEQKVLEIAIAFAQRTDLPKGEEAQRQYLRKLYGWDGDNPRPKS